MTGKTHHFPGFPGAVGTLLIYFAIYLYINAHPKRNAPQDQLLGGISQKSALQAQNLESPPQKDGWGLLTTNG